MILRGEFEGDFIIHLVKGCFYAISRPHPFIDPNLGVLYNKSNKHFYLLEKTGGKVMPRVNRKLILVLIILTVSLTLTACSKKDQLSAKKPITLTLWHVFGSQTDSPMNVMIDEFNDGIGKENGVIINVTSISNSSDIHDALLASSKGHAGAGELPDMFFCYPETAKTIGSEQLTIWSELFTPEELKKYVPEFLAEGTVDGNLLVFPVAKSSEALFVNSTIFDRFASDTGTSYEELRTWEGILNAARKYYEWSGGKTMVMHDELLNYCQINTTALGGQPFQNGELNFADPIFQHQWNKVAEAAISGHLRVEDNYSTVCMMTGDIIVGIGSTASILYFHDTVTFPDNSTEPLNLYALPCPVTQDGRKIAMQQGTGLAASIKNNPKKEAAALLFAKWITEGETNLRLVTQSGYMPVQETAFNAIEDFSFNNESYRSLYEAMNIMHSEYEFYLPPIIDGYYEVLWKFYDNSIEIITTQRQQYLDKEEELAALVSTSFTKMREAMQ